MCLKLSQDSKKFSQYIHYVLFNIHTLGHRSLFLVFPDRGKCHGSFFVPQQGKVISIRRCSFPHSGKPILTGRCESPHMGKVEKMTLCKLPQLGKAIFIGRCHFPRLGKGTFVSFCQIIRLKRYLHPIGMPYL